MASSAEIEKFEEMIAAVERFINRVNESCSEMEVVGKLCVENCDNDVPSTKAYNKLIDCIRKFQESTEMAHEIKLGLQEELERLYEIIRMADDMD